MLQDSNSLSNDIILVLIYEEKILYIQPILSSVKECRIPLTFHNFHLIVSHPLKNAEPGKSFERFMNQRNGV